jgi:hypothetical protein
MIVGLLFTPRERVSLQCHGRAMVVVSGCDGSQKICELFVG